MGPERTSSPSTTRWTGPVHPTTVTPRFMTPQPIAKPGSATAALPVAKPTTTPFRSRLAEHHQATLQEFRRRGDDVGCWKLRSVIDLQIDDQGITSRWVFVRPPSTTPLVMDVVVHEGRVTRVTPR